MSVLVVIGELGKTHVDAWVHGKLSELVLRNDFSKLSQELFRVLDANLRQEIGEVLDGLSLLGSEGLSLNIGVDLSKIQLVVVHVIILILGSNLSFVFGR